MKLWADGINYHAVLHQNKPDLPYLVMLHGFMGSGRAFDPLTEPLSHICNPLTIDLAGHGMTRPEGDTKCFTAERQAAQIRSLLNRLQLPNLLAYGYSMGGRLLFQLITRYPGLFQGALIESSHCGITDLQIRSERAACDEQRAAEIETDYPAFLDRWQELTLFKQTPHKAKIRYRKIMETQSPELMAASLREFGAGVMPPVCEKLHQLQMPLYLVAGEFDQKYVTRMAQISELNSLFQAHTVPGAGHRVHADQPVKFKNILKTFIQTCHV
jgi:2-succinyl-6-hydroxy-2,4-cyclohexadiene-1-carboxylate synthase